MTDSQHKKITARFCLIAVELEILRREIDSDFDKALKTVDALSAASLEIQRALVSFNRASYWHGNQWMSKERYEASKS